MSTPLADVYAYCLEHSLTHPLEAYPFSWPSPPNSPPSSPSPVLSGCFPPPLLLDDSPTFPSDTESNLTSFLHLNPLPEIYDIRHIHRYKLEQPLLPGQRTGPNHLRRYGPKSLPQIPPFPLIKLSKSDGMNIPSTDEVDRSIKRDGKLTVPKLEAGFLGDMIYMINHPKVVDIVLQKVRYS